MRLVEVLWSNLMLHQNRSYGVRPPPKGACLGLFRVKQHAINHLTGLLDSTGHGAYSQATLQLGRTPGSGLQGARRASGEGRKRGWAAEPNVRSPASMGPPLGSGPGPQPRPFSF